MGARYCERIEFFFQVYTECVRGFRWRTYYPGGVLVAGSTMPRASDILQTYSLLVSDRRSVKKNPFFSLTLATQRKTFCIQG